MQARRKRRIALLLFAVLTFAQLNAAFAAHCPMNGGAPMPQMDSSDMPCDGCDTPLADAHEAMPSVCASQCATSDAQAPVPAFHTLMPPEESVLTLPRAVPKSSRARLDAPPSGAPPHRILQHSFLI